jgi:3-methyladenine DNA glycosylase AlkC
MSQKPARRINEIPADVLAELNAGRIASRNLVEGLAVDFNQLLYAVAPEFARDGVGIMVPGVGLLERMKFVGDALRNRFGLQEFDRFASHPSDTVRGWAAYLACSVPRSTFSQKLKRIRVLADDPHFGVREWAWIALRPSVVDETEAALKLLTPWTSKRSANLRRFASEITRPRGVWCSHIESLKREPMLGLPILEALRSDPSKYVQDSVANWLNDAGKTNPKWVKSLCRRWRKESPTVQTTRICTRGSRNL